MKGYETKHRSETFKVSLKFGGLFLKLPSAGSVGNAPCSPQKTLFRRCVSASWVPALSWGQQPAWTACGTAQGRVWVILFNNLSCLGCLDAMFFCGSPAGLKHNASIFAVLTRGVLQCTPWK